jgi:ferritin
MIPKKIQDAVNDQVNRELFSEYLYLSMEMWCASQNLQGFAHWMHMQSHEERYHGLKFAHHVIDRAGQVELKPLDQPQVNFDSPKQMFELALEQERYTTRHINELYEIALAERDYPLQNLLLWYINEQIEEEMSAEYFVNRLERIGNNFSGLMYLDHEMSKREYESPDFTDWEKP